MKLENQHLCNISWSVRDALIRLDYLASDAILIVVNDDNVLVGSLTDGDLRRGFIKGLGFDNALTDFIQSDPKFIFSDMYEQEVLESYRKNNYKIIPIVNRQMEVVDILNFRTRTTILPLDAVLMAGGEGRRLRPLTEQTPKPLLKVGEKPIIEYNIDRLAGVGVKNFHISINYLGEQIENYFEDGSKKNIQIQYIKEDRPLGTIGSVLLADSFQNKEIIVMNSDLLTNIDFADFYKAFTESEADMAVAATTYSVDIPYAVLEANESQKVVALKEKPRYNYFSNAGIYLMKTSLLELIPPGVPFHVTDLMEKIIEMNLSLVTYPINAYWLDIGKPDDFKKAQEDIKHIKMH